MTRADFDDRGGISANSQGPKDPDARRGLVRAALAVAERMCFVGAARVSGRLSAFEPPVRRLR